MRRFFLVLMIALLPLRGWMDAAMATEMVAPAGSAWAASAVSIEQQRAADVTQGQAHAHSAAPHTHAGTEQIATVSASPGCADHAGSGHAPTDNSHCKSCVVCQACNAVGLAFPAAMSSDFHATPEKSPYMVSSFASADRALSLKPPIS